MTLSKRLTCYARCDFSSTSCRGAGIHRRHSASAFALRLKDSSGKDKLDDKDDVLGHGTMFQISGCEISNPDQTNFMCVNLNHIWTETVLKADIAIKLSGCQENGTKLLQLLFLF